ncbi:MAG: helix-turn-helix transcriptional regulator [Gammaproteobacteria bacterium]|nr:helix-turn-helix transcriptional regulator [Gammaproteobacteria bacterium]
MNKPITYQELRDNPTDLQKSLGRKAKALRLRYGYKRTTLSEKSGVSPETIRNFEQSGKITLENFLKIAFALDESRKLHSLFEADEITSIREIEDRQQPLPKRGRR